MKKKPLCIICVDDDRSQLALLEAYLKNEGHEVTVFEDGVDALEHLERTSERVHLVVSDEQMFMMNGSRLLEKLREIPRYAELPFVIRTGGTLDHIRSRVERAGAKLFSKYGNIGDTIGVFVQQLTANCS